jgi:hypothetical protein
MELGMEVVQNALVEAPRLVLAVALTACQGDENAANSVEPPVGVNPMESMWDQEGKRFNMHMVF